MKLQTKRTCAFNTKDHCGYILVSFYKGFELFYLFKVNCMIVFSLDFCCLEKKEIMRNIRSLYVLSWEIVRLKTVT
jgi:hypothetical protein